MRRLGIIAVAALASALASPAASVAVEPAAGAESTPDTAPVADAARRERAGHDRMLAELAAAHEAALRDNPYVGAGQIEQLRAALAALPAQAPDLGAWELRMQLGQHLLRVGRDREAVDEYEAAARELARFDAPALRRAVVTTMYETAVAWMRLGESQNCVTRHTPESCIFPLRGGGVHVDPTSVEQAATLLRRITEMTTPNSYFHVKARWLLNLATMAAGTWPDGVPAALRLPAAVAGSDEPFPRFPQIATALGLDTFDLSGGAIADDFDGDGRLDLVVSTLDTAGQMHFFRNDGDGGFQDRTAAAGLTGLVGGLNMVHADYDNDGDPDLLVLRGAWFRALGRHPNSLLRNDGGRFTDVTFAAGLGEAHWPTQTAAWADYDNDGDLDLYVGNESDPTFTAPCQLFRNEGDGTFTDVAARAGVTNLGYAKGVAWGDYDDDGDADLYVSNMGSDNRLYRNDGDGTFTDVADAAGVTGPTASFATWFWDADNDGALDLFVASYGTPNRPDVADLAASILGLPDRAERPHLYRGDGRGGFAEIGADAGLSHPWLVMGANWGDIDTDGWPDAYLGTGYPLYEALTPNVMLRNRGGEGFADVSVAGGFAHLQKGHAVVFADLDDDGDQDLFEQLGGAYPGDAFGNALWLNPGFGRRWLTLRLVGTDSNRSAIGARIRVDVAAGDTIRSIRRRVGSGGSFGGNPLRQEIGLGDADRLERVVITWPRSGATQVVTGIPLDRQVVVTEGKDGFVDVTPKPVDLGG